MGGGGSFSATEDVGAIVLRGGMNVLSVRAGGENQLTTLRADSPGRKKITAGALEAYPLTEVTGIDVDAGRIAGVRTARGAVRTDTVVICCGVRLRRQTKSVTSLMRRTTTPT